MMFSTEQARFYNVSKEAFSMGAHEVEAQVRQLTKAASSLADLTAITTEAIASGCT